jgi:CheY-like chemotaxis protein
MYGTETLARSPAPELQDATIDLMRKALTQSADLTKSLLVYARRDAVTPRAVDVDELIRDTAPLLSALLGKGAALVTSLQADGGRVVMDPAQLRQVVLNLAGNALDATRGYGSRVEIKTCIDYVDDSLARRNGALEGGKYMLISVEDDGRGMDAHTISRVFEPFFTTKERGKGTGLGLAMCHSIVRRAGGFITVDSEVGAGTRCRVYVPLVAAPAPENESDILEMPASSSLKCKVLIVEDDAVIRGELAEGLRGLDVVIFSVGTVAEARRILAERPIDLLVTDGSLSDGLGRILARTARAARPSLRVLLVSGVPEPADEFDATLPKPFTRQALLEAVTRLLPATGLYVA